MFEMQTIYQQTVKKTRENPPKVKKILIVVLRQMVNKEYHLAELKGFRKRVCENFWELWRNNLWICFDNNVLQGKVLYVTKFKTTTACIPQYWFSREPVFSRSRTYNRICERNSRT